MLTRRVKAYSSSDSVV